MTIPGIDYYTAIALIAEIGDIKRFPTKRHLCSYSGVVPKARNSGDVVSQHQRVKHGNNVLKYFLTNAVQGILKTKKNTAIKIFYRKKEKQIGAPKAQVAAARKLASVVWWVLTNKKPYVDEDPVLTKRKHKNMNAKAIKAEKEISQEDIKKLIGEIEQKRDVLDRIIHDVENG
jgi:hypothetical protein